MSPVPQVLVHLAAGGVRVRSGHNPLLTARRDTSQFRKGNTFRHLLYKYSFLTDRRDRHVDQVLVLGGRPLNEQLGWPVEGNWGWS